MNDFLNKEVIVKVSTQSTAGAAISEAVGAVMITIALV